MAIVFAFLCVTISTAQEHEIRTSRPPHYAGKGATVQIVVQGLEEAPEPQCNVAGLPAGVTARLVGVSPQVSTVQQYVNGRVSVSKSVVHRINYLVDAAKPGTYTVGPFTVSQGSTSFKTDTVTLEFEEIGKDPDVRIKLIVPEKPVFPGERVPVTIEWWYGGRDSRVRELSIRTSIFDRFQFDDSELRRAEFALPIQTAEGEIQLPAKGREETVDGKEFVVYLTKRILVPDKSGTFEFEPITAIREHVTRWERQRDSFGFGGLLGGGQRPAESVLLLATGNAARLIVKQLPVEGRPDSFAGAVGPGYSLDVTADRTVVRVGDPITLELALRGSGNIENAGFPKLSADGGLDPSQFRLPEERPTGTLEDDRKTFNVTVRVEDESVSDIPAIAYSWFDPLAGEYRTTHSKPIALRVMPAKIVSAGDVVSSVKRTSNVDDASGSGTSAEIASASPTSASSFSLSGADLSVEYDPAKVLVDSRSRATFTIVPYSMYLLGVIVVVGAVLLRRRQNISPELTRRRSQHTAVLQQIARAKTLPKKEAAEEVSTALRLLLSDATGETKQGLDTLIAKCEGVTFAPTTASGERLSDQLFDEAATLTQEVADDES